MPTTKPRHQVTETPALTRALDVAARRWPGKSRSALLAALAEAGAEAIESSDADARAARRKLVEDLAGGFDFPDGYLEELRQDWPE